MLAAMADVVRLAFERFVVEGPEAVRDVLDPDVDMLAQQPGPWDCHGRDAVIQFLHGYQASGATAQVLEVTAFGDRILLGLRRRTPDGDIVDGYSIITLDHGRVRTMQAHGPREAAVAALAAI